MFETQHTEGLRWEIVWQEALEAVYKEPNVYFPIEPVNVPVVFTDPRIIVYPSDPTALPWLWLGAKLTARADIPSIDPAVRIYQQNLRLNHKNYLEIPIASTYSIVLEIPWKFTQMAFTIWEWNPQ